MTQGLIGWIPNGAASDVRASINAADAALASENEGSSAPSPTQPFMLWRNNTAKIVKRRNSANNGWNIEENYGATSDPGMGDDTADGYVLGSVWRNITAKKTWYCEDNAAGGARWVTIEHLSVKQFGAKGDGVTDDTAAITAAIAAMPWGGCLYFPSGYYKISSTININKPGSYVGSGVSSCFIVQNANTGTFNVTASYVDIIGFTFQPSVGISMLTSGTVIEIDASYVNIDNFRMFNCHYGIIIHPVVSVVTISRGWIRYIHASTGVGILIEGGFDLSVFDVGMWCDTGVPCSAGIAITGCGDLTLDSLTIMQCGNNILINPPAGNVVASIFLINSFLDTATRGLYICPATGGNVVRCAATQNWFSSHSSHGIDITSAAGGTIDGFDINVAHCFLNNSNGINVFGANTKNVRINQAECAQNVGAGIAFAGSTQRFLIANSRSGDTCGLTGNQYGCFIDTGCFGYIVNANDFTGNTTNLIDAGSGKVVANNL